MLLAQLYLDGVRLLKLVLNNISNLKQDNFERIYYQSSIIINLIDTWLLKEAI